MTRKKQKADGKNLQDFIVWGLAALTLVMVINAVTLSTLGTQINTQFDLLKEASNPAELNMAVITVDCEDCLDVATLVTGLKTTNIKLLKEEYFESGSSEAQQLITQYAIKTLPTVVLTGEIDKETLQGFEKSGDALVLTGLMPPYVDAVTGDLLGIVGATLIEDSTCAQCGDLTQVVQGLETLGIAFSDVVILDFTSQEARALLESTENEKVPVLLVSDDIEEYGITQQLSGVTLIDGYYLFETNGPYVNASTGELRGLMDLTMLVDESCSDCYDVTLHKPILQKFSMAIETESTVDISSDEGKVLLEKYSITKVPTIILTGDVGAYSTFGEIWEEVGTVEDDGTYVFRTMSVLGNIVFTDLEQ